MRVDRADRDTQDPVIPPSWRDGEVAVIGLGKTGTSVVRALRRLDVRVYASDKSDTDRIRQVADELRGAGASLDVGSHDLNRIATSQALIVSPGIPPSAAPVRKARDSGVEVWSEIDLASLSLQGCRIVGVTGTNGKTTTTALIDHLFRSAGVSSVAAGNIGLPLIEVAQYAAPPDWIVVELSSFQLHYSNRLKPTIGVLTNLQPDHLDWYRDQAAYYADKKRLFLHADSTSRWIINGDDTSVEELISGVPGRVERWRLNKPADAWFDENTARLLIENEEILPRGRYPLLGDHNVSNALAAALATHVGGLSISRIAAGLTTMTPLEHRLETVASTRGVRWVNDSKATNVASACAGISAIDGNIVLIVGGLDKGEDFGALTDLVRARCSAVVAYGAAADKLASELDFKPLQKIQTLDQAVQWANDIAQPGDTVLLSPACASFDQFENYMERGNTFRELVARI